MFDPWTVLGPLLGSGFATVSIGWLFKRRFDRELELQKAFLQRASRVHDRQVDALTRLYGFLFEAQAYLQLLSASVQFSGEKPEEYPRLFTTALIAARQELTKGRLLLPASIVGQCDNFFNVVFQGTMHLGFANDPMVIAAGQRAEFWDRATKTAYQDIPHLLATIELHARVVIHGAAPY
jgi:hypothetical protein